MSEIYLGERSFIKTYQIDDLAICNQVIKFWQDSREKIPGTNYNSYGDVIVNKKIKDSIDVGVPPNNDIPIFQEFIKHLQLAVDEYIKEYDMCNWSGPWRIVETSAIQYYPPGGGYKVWHCERGVAGYPISTRHLAWMTYLNDVEEGGETEFYYQNVKVKPKKGLTLIWPADWTHTHRGIVAPNEEKYIITGWFNYVEKR